MLSFDIGLSGLRASQQSSNVIGQNLTNANTPGYHRQVADLASSAPVPVGGFLIGTGVEVTDIQQLRDGLIEKAITSNTSDLGSTQSQLDMLNQVQTTFGHGSGTLGTDLENFFNQLQQLSAQPANTALRQVVISSATTLTGQFNSLSGSFDSFQSGLNAQAQDVVNGINSDTQQIAQLNSQIQQATIQGQNPNDQRDQRDQLVHDLAKRIGVQSVPQNFGQVSIVAGGAALVVGNENVPLQFSLNSSNQAVVTVAGSATPLTVTGGQLGGLLALRNQTLPGYKSRLDLLAGALTQRVDNVQATGLGLSGPSTLLSSQRAVQNTTAPLPQAGLALPPRAGTLYVSVTNLASGQRTLTPVTIDPATQSLQDVANALSAIPNLQAVTNAQAGTLQILAGQGYAFDFTGQAPTAPSAAGITGTTRPQLAGAYTGSANDAYTYSVVGSGTVGVTPGLTLQVKDTGGDTVANLAIGQGYSPGSSLAVANGVTVQLAAGTANNGDAFTSPVIAQPDTSGILTSLGLGTFFQGTTAADLKVQDALVSNPNLLAGSRTGEPGDATNLNRLVALRDQPGLGGGTQTFSQAYNTLVGDIGTQVSDLGNLQTSQTSLGQQLTAQQQSVSGVDPNEELVNLLNSQHAFQVASKYISVVNDTLNSLLQIL